ncbi:hypothetical protein FIBSPDRAFT_937169 [Athelia psychrophila]|uniref:GST N-terminal domain-containing protein n=1 Tax=Athelia psychrophila TaxID=1759441 RepID=A0A166AX57_9AGAM|nr:hypothetical protein FIBSPDRAFT_937169 [Fibularhizoctonia sp. CBS 109695]
MSQPRIVLYSADVCPWAHRARIALKASGAKYETVEINLQDKPSWYATKINPASKVPALSYGAPADSDVSSPPAGTFLLPESGVIVGFVASLFPSIDYKDVIIRAKAALAQAQYESLVAPHWGQLQRQGGKSEDFDAVVTGLKNWSAALPEEILGEEYGVADALLGPFVTRLFLFSKLDVGVWPAGTGPKLLSAISGPEYAKLHKFAKKLQGWSAITETVDEDALVVRFREFFKNT